MKWKLRGLHLQAGRTRPGFSDSFCAAPPVSTRYYTILYFVTMRFITTVLSKGHFEAIVTSSAGLI